MIATLEREVYIEVWHGRVVIGCTTRSESGYTVQRAANWHELEEEARFALKSMETPMNAAVFPCPPFIAQRAVFIEAGDSDWISLSRGRHLSGLTAAELKQAIARGYLETKVLFDAEGQAHRFVRRSQMAQVWSMELARGLAWLREDFPHCQDSLFNARFWNKAQTGSRDECWTWKASKTRSGYGVFWMNGKHHLAHRHAYELTRGPIPEDEEVVHVCGNRACVNPGHLTIG